VIWKKKYIDPLNNPGVVAEVCDPSNTGGEDKKIA
jgi:hypothetical protein